MRKQLAIATLLIGVLISTATSADAARRRINPDNITRATPMISSEQVGIHDGRGYIVTGISGDIATGSFFWASIETGANPIHLHAVDPWIEGSYGVMVITEGPTADPNTASGTQIIPINLDRTSSATSSVTAYSNVNVAPAVGGFTITNAATATEQFQVTGAATATFSVGDAIWVEGSTGNDGYYYVFDVSYAAPTSTITVNNVADATADGTLYNLGAQLSITAFTANKGTSDPRANFDAELILEADKVYLFGIKNNGAAAYDMGVWTFWTEDE